MELMVAVARAPQLLAIAAAEGEVDSSEVKVVDGVEGVDGIDEIECELRDLAKCWQHPL